MWMPSGCSPGKICRSSATRRDDSFRTSDGTSGNGKATASNAAAVNAISICAFRVTSAASARRIWENAAVGPWRSSKIGPR
jgi:hypothetical protein